MTALKALLRICVFVFFLISCETGKNTEERGTKSAFVEFSAAEPLNKVSRLSFTDLSEKFQEKSMTIHVHPAYSMKKKTFYGYSFQEILRALYPQMNLDQEFWVNVTTEDGWSAPRYSGQQLLEGGALLAIRESRETLNDPISSDGKWTLVVTPKKKLYPGPFFFGLERLKKEPRCHASSGETNSNHLRRKT